MNRTCGLASENKVKIRVMDSLHVTWKSVNVKPVKYYTVYFCRKKRKYGIFYQDILILIKLHFPSQSR